MAKAHVRATYDILGLSEEEFRWIVGYLETFYVGTRGNDLAKELKEVLADANER